MLGCSGSARAHSTNSSAFTLVELLVVISIIALLIALLLPALLAARVTAGQTTCLSGARQVSIGVSAYNTDWRQYYPANMGDPADPLNPVAGPSAGDDWYQNGYHNVLVRRDYASRSLFTNRGCPFGPTTYNPWSGDSIRVGIVSATDSYRPVNSYGLLPVLQGGKGRVSSFEAYLSTPSGTFYGQQKTTMKRIARHPDKVVTITCHGTAGMRVYASGFGGFARGLLHMVDERPVGTSDVIDSRYVRHGARGLPMVMTDGHGQVTPKKEIWDDIDMTNNNRPYIDPKSVMYYSFVDLYEPTYPYDF